nr:MAG: putative nuclease of the RecB family [Candidatus Nanosalinarum sp. J07AB56]
MEHVEEEPGFEAAADTLREYLPRDYTVQVNGKCRVSYSGRTQSKLDRGDRMILVKQDSALLVHGPDNYQPRNWQPEVDRWSVGTGDGALTIEARRLDPEEVVEIELSSIELVTVSQMVDESELKISGHEVDIHEAIEETPEIVEDGFNLVARERKTPAGYIDVLGRDMDGAMTVVEVKRNPDYNTALQLQRYVDEIEEEFSGDVRGILVAPKLSDEVDGYLNERGLEFVEVDMDDIIQDYKLQDSQSGLSDFGPEYSTG